MEQSIVGMKVCHNTLTLPPGTTVDAPICEYNPDDCCGVDTTIPSEPIATDPLGKREMAGFWVQTRNITIPQAQLIGKDCTVAQGCPVAADRILITDCAPGIKLPKQLSVTVLHYPDYTPVPYQYMGNMFRHPYWLHPTVDNVPGMANWGGYAIRKPVVTDSCEGWSNGLSGCWLFNFQICLNPLSNMWAYTKNPDTNVWEYSYAKTVKGVSNLCFYAIASIMYMGTTVTSTHYAGMTNNVTYFTGGSSIIPREMALFNWVIAPEPGWSLDPFYMEFKTPTDSWSNYYGGTVPEQWDSLGLSYWRPPYTADEWANMRAGIYVVTE